MSAGNTELEGSQAGETHPCASPLDAYVDISAAVN